MKRASTGRGSLQQPGVLKPRNEDFTPKNRQSGGDAAARRSFIPKIGHSSKAKPASSRMGRASTENMLRHPQQTSSRFTPTRLNTPACVPQSASRLSADSNRYSGVGASTRKDMRYFTDPAYKTQCIDKILDFLRSKYQNSYQRRSLLTPTTKDLMDIFTFLYRHFEPNYTLPTRFDEEIPKLMIKLRCPVQLTKNHFATVGSPHTWPLVLAALAFLVDAIQIQSIMQDDSGGLDDSDVEDEVDPNVRLCIHLFRCSDDRERNDCLETYGEDMRVDNGVGERDLMELEDELQERERELESLPVTADELRELKQCSAQCSDDIVKLNTYLQSLKDALQNKLMSRNNIKQVIEDLNVAEKKVQEEVESLKRLQIQQGYNRTELLDLKNHGQQIGKEIEYQENLGKDISSQCWKMEVELSKAQASLRDCLVQFEGSLEKQGLSAEFSDIDIRSDELNLHSGDVMERLMTLKKNAKKATSQAQNKLWELDQDLVRAKGKLQENKAEFKKLEAKMRHMEEEHEVMQEEMAREEQLRLEEDEALHQRLMETRKKSTGSTYLMQLGQMLNDKTQELHNYKKREERCLYEGAQFQMKIHQEAMQAVEAENNMIAQFTKSIDAECKKFLAWFDS